MAWNGSGTYTIAPYIWVNDLNAGVAITASRMDSEFSDVATGINSCLAKNGENAATGNLNIGGFRLTSTGNATARTDAIPAGQIQDGGVTYIAAAGTNTITATLAPAITAYTNGQIFAIKFANTTTGNSTLAFNGLTALNTYYADGTTRLPGGECIQSNIGLFQYVAALNSAAGGFVLLNPSRITGSFTITLTGMTAGTTGTINYAIQNDGKSFKAWAASSITGTSNTTAMTGTGVPAILTTTTSKNEVIDLENNTVASIGVCQTGTSTTWSFGNPGLSGFTSSGVKGLLAGSSFTSSLD